jgi:tetratricopeptide (TPR) repeat protein
VALSLRAASVLAVVALLAGCAAGATATAPRATPVSPEPSRADGARSPRGGTAEVATFPRTAQVLHDEIGNRAEALRAGPIGHRARELASLRLAASGRDLMVSGSAGGALEALDEALSLYGANGYAYLFLASVHRAEGRRDEAGKLTANARRYLPADEGVQAELEGLVRSIGEAR